MYRPPFRQRSCDYNPIMPSRDAQWIIGTIVAVGVILFSQNAGINTRIDDVNAQIAILRDDVRRMDDRLRNVEIAFGKVDQRLLTLERLHLPTPAPGD